MPSVTYRFGEFRLDTARRELRRDGAEVPLHRKAFDCLVYLIEHRERAVARDDLFRAVWGDVHLSDNVLHQSIFEARRAVGDTGDGQRCIRTMRAFGYRWVAPVEEIMAPEPRRRPLWLGVALALAAAGALATGTAYLTRTSTVHHPTAAASSQGGARLALVLPVIVEDGTRQVWMRLGLMESIAERLNAAGQPTVPADTVVALLRGRRAGSGPAELRRLTATTGAGLVFEARAARRGRRWWLSLKSIAGAESPLIALADDADALIAARTAADRLARAQGLEPAPERELEPGLAALLQRVEAATLAGDHEAARALLEAADPALRLHPEVRFQLAHLALARHDLRAARDAYESLLVDLPSARLPRLRARILHCLGEIHLFRGELAAAESRLEEAVSLRAGAGSRAANGRIRAALGKVALFRGDFDAARAHFARARIALEDTGDAVGLADLHNHLGVLAALRERYAEAARLFATAADEAAALQDPRSELGNRANLLYVHLGLLDPVAARVVERRLRELSAEVANPWMTAWADLTHAYLLAATGRSRAADRVLADVLAATAAVGELDPWRLRALVLAAELAARAGHTARAAEIASTIVARMPPEHALVAEERGRAWLIAVRAHLAGGDRATARRAARALAAWAEHREVSAPVIYGALARAEVAAADGREVAAGTAFERALTLAEASGVPLHLLQVAQVYVPWLLAGEPARRSDRDRALVVADRLADYAERDYEAALLQLRVQWALGSPAGWRTALVRARSLAGERRVPAELLVAPAQAPRVAIPG